MGSSDGYGFRREMSLWGHNMGSQGSRPDNYRELSGQPLVKMTGYDIVFWPSARQLIKNVSPKTGEDDREKYFYLKVCEDTDLGGRMCHARHERAC